MPREVIVVQVGQCGNQIGTDFWRNALHEHRDSLRYTEALSTFFRNVDANGAEIGFPSVIDPLTGSVSGSGSGLSSSSAHPVDRLKARGVLVDMEDGVLNSLLSGPLSSIFDDQLLLSDSAGVRGGSGNNWAHGYLKHGAAYASRIEDVIQRALEPCDSPQAFMLCHSLGGGTGSGFGSRVAEILADVAPEMSRLAVSVFPSPERDDVMASPFNSVLSLSHLLDSADVIVPFENERLAQLAQRPSGPPGSGSGSATAAAAAAAAKADKLPWRKMNSIISSVMCDATASMRFGGALNVDINELAMNLVPFSRLSLACPALAPLPGTQIPAAPASIIPRLFRHEAQCCDVDPAHSSLLASALLVRSPTFSSTAAHDAVQRARKALRFAWWAQDAYKVGLCAVPPQRCASGPAGTGRNAQFVTQDFSVLALTNCSGSAETVKRLRVNLQKMTGRGPTLRYFHHYEEFGLERTDLKEATEKLLAVERAYRETEVEAPSVTRYPEAVV
jgi:tubulin epsilon